jgi:hypothetical protein
VITFEMLQDGCNKLANQTADMDKPVVSQKQYKMCTSKERYATKQAAMFFAKVRLMRVYKCLYCGGWHLTTIAAIRKMMRGKCDK